MNQTQELIESWLRAKTRKDEADRIANSAKCALANAINDLGKRLMPELPRGQGELPEQVTSWVPLDEEYERLLVIQKKKGYGDGDYSLEFRGEKRKI